MKFNFCLVAIVLSLLASLIPIPGTDVWYSQFVAVMLFGFLFIGILISEMSVPLGILFFYLVFSVVFITKQDTMALMCLMQVTGCLLIARYISSFNPTQRKKTWLFIGVLLAIQVFWGFLQKIGIDPVFRLSTNHALCDTVGFSGSHNQYGLFLAGASPIAFLYPLSIPFVFLALVFSKTFSAILGFSVALIFFFHKKFNMVILTIIMAVAITGFFFISHKDISGQFGERFGLWKLTATQALTGNAVMEYEQVDPLTHKKVRTNAVAVVKCNPLFGFGFQKFFTISPYTQIDVITHGNQHRYEHAHNDYVEALFDLGLIGFGLVIIVIGHMVILYRRAFKSKYLRLAAAGLIAYAVCALSIYTIHTAYNGFFLCVLIGLFYAEVKDGTQGR